MNYDKIVRALKKSWCKESSSKYEIENPSKGQCSVTAIVIQRIFGGEILKTNVNGSWHFYNKIDNSVFDFTAEQFADEVEYMNESSSAEEALTDCNESQVAALFGKSKNALEENEIE